MRDALLIRPPTEDDEAFARATHHLAFREVVERQFGPWDEAQQDAFFAGFWGEGAAKIVEVDGERCGYLGVEERGDVVHVHGIVLHPDFHGRGIGTQLLTDVVERARSLGVPVRLGVLFENHRARALYERLGFRAFGQNAAHHLMELRTRPES